MKSFCPSRTLQSSRELIQSDTDTLSPDMTMKKSNSETCLMKKLKGPWSFPSKDKTTGTPLCTSLTDATTNWKIPEYLRLSKWIKSFQRLSEFRRPFRLEDGYICSLSMVFTLRNWKVTSQNPKTRRIKCFLLRKWRNTKDLRANRFGFIEESPTWLSLAETIDSRLPYTSPTSMTDVIKSGRWGEIILTCRILKRRSLTILKSWQKYWTNKESSTQSFKMTVLTKKSRNYWQT